MTSYQELRENTCLIDRYFPINIFLNNSAGDTVLNIHWHENIEILYLLEGHAVFNIGGQNVNAAPRDILFVNKGLLHSAFVDGTVRVKYYAVVFDIALLASQTPDPSHTRLISPFMQGNSLFPLKIPVCHEKHRCIEEPLLKIIDEFSKKLPGYEVAIKAYLHLLTTNIYRYFLHSSPVNTSPDVYNNNVDSIKNLINFVQRHFTEKITITEASRMVNLSPYYFCKTFKKVTGRTFIEFLNLYRINEAEQLLKNTQLSVTEIAEKTGFCNINYFDRIFKQIKRYPPSNCRK